MLFNFLKLTFNFFEKKIPVYVDMATGIANGTVGAAVRGSQEFPLLFASLEKEH
jgi:hypothetical protein